MKKTSKTDISDVARAAKVSIATVSRVFNHPNLVAPTTRRAVEQAVNALGYVRHRAAPLRGGKRSGAVGLIVPTIDNAIFAEMIQAFSESVEAGGFTLMMATCGFDLWREHQALRKFLEQRADGVALIGLDHLEETHQLLSGGAPPTITIWSHEPNARLPCVGADNRDVGRRAAEHLLTLGHRRIGLVFPPTAANDRARARLEGALETLEAADAAPPETWRSQSPYNVSQAKQACLDLLAAPPRPTALLCGNDVIAQGALYAARRLNIMAPAALSVIGVGDFAGSAAMEPALTTVRIPARRIGALAGRQLVGAIGGSAPPAGARFEGELAMRGTTAPPPF